MGAPDIAAVLQAHRAGVVPAFCFVSPHQCTKGNADPRYSAVLVGPRASL